MNEAARLSSLIGDIYDAALDPGLWPAVLESTANFVGGGSCNLSSTDTGVSACDIHIDWNSDPYYVELMATKYHRMYPLAPLAMAFGHPGDVLSCEVLMPYEEFARSRFYVEWCRPQGLRDAVAAVLEKSATKFATVSVMRFEEHGLVDDHCRAQMALLAPHYRRAVAIGKVLEQRNFVAATLAEALDGLAAGIFMVDGRGNLLRSNAAGARMLDDRQLVQGARGKLTALDPQANIALQEALAGAGGGDEMIGARGIALPLAEADDGRWVAHILPMSAGTRRDGSQPHQGMAAVFVQKLALDRPPALEAIATRYRLTPAELRTMLAIAEGGSVAEVAPLLGMAEATVRSHLHRVFAKTDTSRQSDLVKLLASFASPLA